MKTEHVVAIVLGIGAIAGIYYFLMKKPEEKPPTPSPIGIGGIGVPETPKEEIAETPKPEEEEIAKLPSEYIEQIKQQILAPPSTSLQAQTQQLVAQEQNVEIVAYKPPAPSQTIVPQGETVTTFETREEIKTEEIAARPPPPPPVTPPEPTEIPPVTYPKLYWTVYMSDYDKQYISYPYGTVQESSLGVCRVCYIEHEGRIIFVDYHDIVYDANRNLFHVIKPVSKSAVSSYLEMLKNYLNTTYVDMANYLSRSYFPPGMPDYVFEIAKQRNLVNPQDWKPYMYAVEEKTDVINGKDVYIAKYSVYYYHVSIENQILNLIKRQKETLQAVTSNGYEVKVSYQMSTFKVENGNIVIPVV